MDTASLLWRAYLQGVREYARSERTTAKAAKPKPSDIVAVVRSFLADLKWELRIPGTHYSGLSNQALLEVRANEGRDFAADTVQLRQHLRRELAERFRGFDRAPTLSELRDLTSKLIVNFIASDRVLHGGGDVILPALSPAYAAWKRKQGKGGKPIGVYRGDWLRALRKARVEFT